MLSSKPYTGATKLVLAFDIGTTFSEISYCLLEPGRVPKILGVTRFPAQERVRGDPKVPSLLYYDKDGVVQAAGAEVLAENIIERALTEGWTKAEWWKLHLRPNHLVSSINLWDDLPPLPTGKSAVDVLADFIKYLFNCAKTYIHDRYLGLSWSTVENSIEFIFTHPNGWEGMQQQMYRRAVELTGLIPSTPEGHPRVHLLTEGEAALHFCVSKLLRIEETDESPQGVVVIDAGSVTVDVSMFSVKRNPISCKEIAPAECRLQGSVNVTCRARILLQQKLQGWEGSSEEKINEFTREFDASTKLMIKSDKEPAYIRVAGRRYNNSKYNITFGKLRLSGKEATSLFNDSIDAIIDAFEHQAKYAIVPITTAFIVGGLSTNDWVWSRLQSYFKARNISISRPDNHIHQAVTNGAVLFCVDHDNYLVASRVARATYGVICALPVDKEDEQHLRRKHQWEVDASGDCYVPGYFVLNLYKGTCVPLEMEFRETFSLTGNDPNEFFDVQSVRLVCYRGDLLDPKWVDEDESSFSTLCTIDADLSAAVSDLVKKTTAGQTYYQLDYDVIIFFGLTELKAQVAWETKEGERRRAPATIRYEGQLGPSTL